MISPQRNKYREIKSKGITLGIIHSYKGKHSQRGRQKIRNSLRNSTTEDKGEKFQVLSDLNNLIFQIPGERTK